VVDHDLKGSFLAISALPVEPIESNEPIYKGEGCFCMKRACPYHLGSDSVEFSNKKEIILFCTRKLANLTQNVALAAHDP